jgi:serine/threonine-protein kinase TTK/MPS1
MATTSSSMSTTSPLMSTTSPSMSTTSPLTPSPPRTPVDSKPRTTNTTPNSDDSSIIDDLSFDYVFDHEGNYVRLSKGSSSKSNHSSPPTPPDIHLKPDPPQRRASLSRSESAHAALNVAPSDSAPARSFQRVVSGPALSSQKARPFPRRVTLEDSKPRPLSGTGLSRPSRITDVSSEKENIESDNHDHLHGHPLKSSVTGASARVVPTRTGYSRPLLADAHQRQILPGPNRAGRIMKSIGYSLGLTKPIPESHSTGTDDFQSDYETDPGMFPFHLSFTLLTFV